MSESVSLRSIFATPQRIENSTWVVLGSLGNLFGGVNLSGGPLGRGVASLIQARRLRNVALIFADLGRNDIYTSDAIRRQAASVLYNVIHGTTGDVSDAELDRFDFDLVRDGVTITGSQVDVTDAANLRTLQNMITDVQTSRCLPSHFNAHCALPPEIFGPLVDRWADVFGTSGRLVLEKPIGIDLLAAANLDLALEAAQLHSVVTRVDHFLHIPALLRFIHFRVGDTFLAQTLNQSLQSWDVEWIWFQANEDYVLDGREFPGNIVDNAQNHQLEIAKAILMEVPKVPTVASMLQARSRAAKFINPPAAVDVRVGQYDEYDSYFAQPTDTETAVCANTTSDDPRWAGTLLAFTAIKGVDAGRSDWGATVFYPSLPSALAQATGMVASQPAKLVLQLNGEQTLRLIQGEREFVFPLGTPLVGDLEAYAHLWLANSSPRQNDPFSLTREEPMVNHAICAPMVAVKRKLTVDTLPRYRKGSTPQQVAETLGFALPWCA